MRKLLAIVVILTLCLSAMPVWALDGDSSESPDVSVVDYAVEGGNIYFDSTSGTIVGCDDTVTTLTIPEEIAGVK